MRRTALLKKPPKTMVAQGVPLPASVGGWDGISPLANMPVDRAVQLDNWVPRPGWIEPRKGSVVQCTGVGLANTPVQSLMAYNGFNSHKLFAVAAGSIYDVTNKGPAVVTSVTGLGSSRMQRLMFSNAANLQYLITVNGTDKPWSFDGASWAQQPIVIGFATGSIIWSSNFLPGETINLNGTIVTFVSGTPSGNQVKIGATLAASLAALLLFLQASSDPNIVLFTYAVVLGTTLELTAVSSGFGGNSLTIQAGFATGSIAFASNPANGDTITLNGTIIEFVTSGASTDQVNIAATLAGTLASLLAVLQDSSDSNINQFVYSIVGSILQIRAASAGVLGNTLTIAASAATASGVTLVGGSTAAASGQTLTGGAQDYGIDSSQFICVNSYMSRLWFVPINSTNVVYMQTVGGISGSASVFPLGQLMRYGGYIMAIGTWTVDTRQNVDEYIAFVTSRGEVIVYQGTDPTTATTFALVGIYKIGAPIGRRCFLRISGDLQIITIDGIVGMSEMLSTDRAAANRVSLTSIIMNPTAMAAQQYKNNFGWELQEFALGTLAILNIPIQENANQMQFVMNTITGAWARFIGINPNTLQPDAAFGINANTWEVDSFDNIYWGGNNGTVYQWNVGSGDGTQPITCVSKGAYNSFGNAAQFKRYMMLQPLITSTGSVVPSLGVNVDFQDINNLSTAQPLSAGGAQWGSVLWNQFKWGSAPTISSDWISVDGEGHYVSIVTAITTYPNPNNPAAYGTFQINGWNILAESGAFV